MTTAALIGLAGFAAPMPGADAAADTQAPTVKLDPYPHFKVGSQVFTDYSEGFLGYWDVATFLKWTASDASGICSQTVAWQSYEFLGSDEDPVLGDAVGYYNVGRNVRTFSANLNEANRSRVIDRFVVRVTDCAGNTATSNIATSAFGIRQDDAASIGYTGNWQVSNFAGFSDGTTHHTSTAGNSFTTTVQGGGPVALVMEKAANRGKADVYVDGVKKATIDTHSLTTRHRMVVWQTVFASGTHTIRVVNKATAGHPRIDLDAVLTR